MWLEKNYQSCIFFDKIIMVQLNVSTSTDDSFVSENGGLLTELMQIMDNTFSFFAFAY